MSDEYDTLPCDVEPSAKEDVTLCNKCHHPCHCDGDLHADEYGVCTCDNCKCKTPSQQLQDELEPILLNNL
jgi:hypothetical protein